MTPPMLVPCPPMYLVAAEAHAHGVVHHERDAVLVGDAGQLLEVRYVEFGVADGLGVDGPRLRRDGPAERLRVPGVHEGRLPAQLLEGIVELLVGAAVEVVGRHDLVAHPGDVEQRQRLRGLPGTYPERPAAAFYRGDALLEDVVGRVHDARVDVAELLEREEVGGVLGVLEHVGARLVDGHRPCPGGDVRALLPGVDGVGLESVGHFLSLSPDFSVVISMFPW